MRRSRFKDKQVWIKGKWSEPPCLNLKNERLGHQHGNVESSPLVHHDALLIVEFDVGAKRHKLHTVELKIRVSPGHDNIIEGVKYLNVVGRYN